MGFIAEIPYGEWEQVSFRVLPFIDSDENLWTGKVVLVSDGTHRIWTGTDGVVLSSLIGGTDSNSYEILIPLRAINAAMRFSSDESSLITVSISEADEDSPEELVVSADEMRLNLPLLPPPPLLPHITVEQETDKDHVLTTFTHSALANAVETIRVAPGSALEELDDPPKLQILAEPDQFRFFVNWEEYGYTETIVDTRSDGRAGLELDPRFLSMLVAAAPSDDITVMTPLERHSALILTSSDWTGLVMPYERSVEVLRPRIEQELTKVFGSSVIHRDHDGDYCLSTVGVPTYARLTDSSPVALTLFAIALDEVEPTPELLKEVNDHNARLGFVRSYVTGSRVVVVADLVAYTIDAPEIEAAFERVQRVANELAPIMALTFGGTTVEPAEDRRWSERREMVVSVEVLPGKWVDLTGPDAIDQWVYDGAVHVVAASNRFGRVLPPAENETATGVLASTLSELDVGFARATSGLPNRDSTDKCFVIWGMDLDDAVALGRQFGQDAIFELTATSVTTIECFSDRVAVVPRYSESDQR